MTVGAQAHSDTNIVMIIVNTTDSGSWHTHTHMHECMHTPLKHTFETYTHTNTFETHAHTLLKHTCMHYT